MVVRKVLRMGDPRLAQKAEPVTEFDTPALHGLVEELFETMAAERGVGLAAPQVGIGLRLVVFGYEQDARCSAGATLPPSVLINPILQPLSDEMGQAWEGCLSLPGLRGRVPRYTRIHYRGFDLGGHVIERQADDFHARVVQHECDHLDGILYPQRMAEMSQFGFLEELMSAGVMDTGRLPCEDERDVGER